MVVGAIGHHGVPAVPRVEVELGLNTGHVRIHLRRHMDNIVLGQMIKWSRVLIQTVVLYMIAMHESIISDKIIYLFSH